MKKFFFISLLFFSCGKVDCESVAEIYRQQECLLIVTKLNDSASVYNFEVAGKSLKSNNDTLYKQENRWFCTYYKFIERGDTIIKSEGELLFKIHKKDTILTFNWECEGKIYK